jgi:hypothetical protein
MIACIGVKTGAARSALVSGSRETSLEPLDVGTRRTGRTGDPPVASVVVLGRNVRHVEVAVPARGTVRRDRHRYGGPKFNRPVSSYPYYVLI